MRGNKLSTGTKTLKWVPASNLRISPRAQRSHTSPGALMRIEDIVQNFDPDQFGTITASYRDGVFWVIDGGHRRCALTKMGYDDQLVQCWVYEGLSEEEEADLFLALNNVRVVSAMDKFKVAVVAGREVETIIDATVRNVGMNVGTGKTGTVRCVSALLKVYDNGGSKVLETALRIIRDSYGDPGFSARVTEGIGLFVAAYQNVFSEKLLISKLERKLGGVNGLIGRAEQIKSSHGVSGPQAIAAATVETYNQGRGGGKLSPWWSVVEKDGQNGREVG